MNRTFTGIVLASAVLVSAAAMAQTNTASAAAPAMSSSAAPSTVAGPQRIGIIRMQDAILGTNEGQRDFQALETKYQPKQADLQKANQKVEDEKKQLSTQGDKMNDEAKAKLTKQLEVDQRELQHNLEAAQQDFQSEQNETYNRIGQKVMQTLDKYAKDNGYGVILDVSNPQSGVLWANLPAVDVTETVVNMYNASSGVPAPAKPAGATTGAPAPRPPASRPPASGASVPPKKP